MISDEQILALANPKLVLRPKLQIAFDRMMAFSTTQKMDEYGEYWDAYLKAGGDRTMIDNGIDLENWRRVKELSQRNELDRSVKAIIQEFGE